jgi:3',5'-cyclic AMP phosphodiesterase CpdA
MRVVAALAVLVLLSACNATLDPYHVYLSLTGNSSEIQLTFTTTSLPPSVVIEYALSSDPTHKLRVDGAKSDTVHYVTPFDHHEYITSLTLTNLQPDSYYDYSIYCNSSAPANKNYQLKTLPSDDDTVDIAMYGDLGAAGAILVSNTSGSIMAWAKDRKMDMIVHYGDLAYNLDTSKGDIGDRFMKAIEPISATMPYVVTAGNHEYMGPHRASESMYRGWFRGQTLLGDRSSSVDPEMWHSFDLGEKLHMIGINTEVYCEDLDHVRDQWEWLEKDLATVRARSVQPWIVVYGHRQLYDGTLGFFHQKLMRLGVECTDADHKDCNFTKPCESGKYCAYSIEQLFDDHYVDLYLAGHQHHYNRMHPIAGDEKYEDQDRSVYLNAQSPVYIVSGAAGVSNHTVKAGKAVRDVNSPPSVHYSTAHGFSLLTVYNTTHLRLRQILLSDAVDDDFWIVKDTSKPKWDKLDSFTLDEVHTGVCDQ